MDTRLFKEYDEYVTDILRNKLKLSDFNDEFQDVYQEVWIVLCEKSVQTKGEISMLCKECLKAYRKEHVYRQKLEHSWGEEAWLDTFRADVSEYAAFEINNVSSSNTFLQTALLNFEEFKKCFEPLKDFRINRTKKHSKTTILFIALVGSAHGCKTYHEICKFAEDNQHELKKVLDLSKGIPSHDTINRFFCFICPRLTSKCTEKWLKNLEYEIGIEHNSAAIPMFVKPYPRYGYRKRKWKFLKGHEKMEAVEANKGSIWYTGNILLVTKYNHVIAFKPNSKWLTSEKIYEVESLQRGGIVVRNDKNMLKTYAVRNFLPVNEWPCHIVEDLKQKTINVGID